RYSSRTNPAPCLPGQPPFPAQCALRASCCYQAWRALVGGSQVSESNQFDTNGGVQACTVRGERPARLGSVAGRSRERTGELTMRFIRSAATTLTLAG